MRRLTISLLVAGGLVASTSLAGAQVPELAGRYQLGAFLGQSSYDESSAIKDDYGGGLDARYFINENVGIGFYFQGYRPDTDGSYFPLVRLEFADTAMIHTVSMEIGNYDVGAAATLRYPLNDMVALYGTGGAGWYVITVDAQAADRPGIPGAQDFTFNDLGFMVGGGANIWFSETAGLKLEVRDNIYTNYDRDEFLNISDPLFTDPSFTDPSDVGIPEKEETIHNLRFNIGFNFIPGG